MQILGSELPAELIWSANSDIALCLAPEPFSAYLYLLSSHEANPLPSYPYCRVTPLAQLFVVIGDGGLSEPHKGGLNLDESKPLWDDWTSAWVEG